MADADKRMREQMEFGWLSAVPEEAADTASSLSGELDAQVRDFYAELEEKHSPRKGSPKKTKRASGKAVGKTKRKSPTRIRCPVCGKQFSQQWNMDRHLKTIHGKGGRGKRGGRRTRR
jgi:uncharacterized C2H2 Zn-finger protein